MATKITPKKTTQKKPLKKPGKNNGSLITKVKWFILKTLLWFFGVSIFFVVLFK